MLAYKLYKITSKIYAKSPLKIASMPLKSILSVVDYKFTNSQCITLKQYLYYISTLSQIIKSIKRK
jgi:hypothetical protein